MGLGLFDDVVVAHHAEIYRYLRRLTWRANEADDLAQETFLRAYRAWQGLGPDANVRAWRSTCSRRRARWWTGWWRACR
jgi:DNA-directed RNA polymerase specialized sigma24 family protein